MLKKMNGYVQLPLLSQIISMYEDEPNGKFNPMANFGKNGQALRTSTGMPPATESEAMPPNPTHTPASIPRKKVLSIGLLIFLIAFWRIAFSSARPESMSFDAGGIACPAIVIGAAWPFKLSVLLGLYSL